MVAVRGAGVMTEPAAGQAAAAVLAERDAIQANLLELDRSYVRQVLDRATLTGRTSQRWEKASATLAELWQTYMAYTAVVDRVAELCGARGPAKKDLPELTALLTGTSVKLTRAPVPLARRDLADTGRQALTLGASVAAMRRAFTEVAEVTSAVETVWSDVGGRLDAAAEELSRLRPLLTGLGEEIAAAVRAADASLDSLRTGMNADPLALWQPGRADTSAADRLAEQVRALAARVAELDRLRGQAQRRIGALEAATAAAKAARRDAATAWRGAAQRISGLPPPLPDIAEPPLASLTALAAAGRWPRLETELDRCERELAAAVNQTHDFERTVATALGRRDELRGLLDAYKAKAARLGLTENADLAARYDQARDLLWTAPCDPAAAEAAVAGYQQAILEEGRRR
jgi:chromosome segregation ATPase